LQILGCCGDGCDDGGVFCRGCADEHGGDDVGRRPQSKLVGVHDDAARLRLLFVWLVDVEFFLPWVPFCASAARD